VTIIYGELYEAAVDLFLVRCVDRDLTIEELRKEFQESIGEALRDLTQSEKA